MKMLGCSDNDGHCHRFQAAMRLDLSKPVLVGRTDEVERIKRAFSDEKSVIFVTGAGGVGKSFLAEQALAAIEEKKVVGKGKFSQYGAKITPFYAIVDAINAATQQILDKKRSDVSDSDISAISQRLYDALGDELGRLTPLLPHLGDLFRKGGNGIGASVAFSLGSEEDKNASTFDRLKHLFRVLLETLSSHVRIVLLIDDIQWIDGGCLDLLLYLTVTKPVPDLFVIAAYRDGNIAPKLANYVEQCKRQDADEIQLTNLDMEELNKLISSYFQMQEEETRDMAELMIHKTAGLPIFATQFLQALQDKKLLMYSVNTYKWTWDIGRIHANMNICDNVVDLVQGRINLLPEQGKVAIQLASCLGSDFQTTVFEGVINHILAKQQSKHLLDVLQDLDVQQVLNLLVAVGLIEQTSEGWHKFAHDRIQQASYSLIAEGSARDQLHLQIGGFLRGKLAKCEKPENWLLFGAVDQLNKATNVLPNEAARIDLANANYQAAQKAFLVSAFLPASKYAIKASQLLNGDSKWTSHYDLTLEVCNLAAKACYSAGKHDESHAMIQEVIEYAGAHSDSLKVRCVEIAMLGEQGELANAIVLGKATVRQHGYNFPNKPNFVQVLRAVRSTSSALLKMSDSEILSMPACKDKGTIGVTKVLESVGLCSYYLSQRQNDIAIANALIVHIMLKNGVTPYSPQAMVMVGSILLAMGRYDASCRLGSLALRLAELHHSTTLAGVMFTAHMCTIHFKKPIQSSLESYLHGYRAGMRVGDIYWASLCSQGYCLTYYFSGLPLQALRQDWSRYLGEMVEYGQTTLRTVHVSLLQRVVNLVDERREDPLEFTSELMDEKSFLAQTTAESNALALFYMYYGKAELAYMWGDFEAAGTALRDYHALYPSSDGLPNLGHLRDTFFRGLISLALARLHGGRRYRRDSQKQIRLLRKWVKAGNINCVDVLSLLLAEQKSLTTHDMVPVMYMYEKAIASATRTGFVQIEALGCECYARYLVSKQELDKARSMFQRAHRCYTKWEATAKARQMEQTFDFDVDTSPEDCSYLSGSRYAGRVRFDGQSSVAHKKLDRSLRRPSSLIMDGASAADTTFSQLEPCSNEFELSGNSEQ